MPDQPVPHVVVDRHLVPGMGACRDGGAHRLGQRGVHAFIRIDFQDPVAGAGRDAGVAAFAFEFPGAFDDARPRGAGDPGAAVGAAVEHDHDLVREGHGGEAIGQPFLLVAGDDEGGEARGGHGAAGTHGRALAFAAKGASRPCAMCSQSAVPSSARCAVRSRAHTRSTTKPCCWASSRSCSRLSTSGS